MRVKTERDVLAWVLGIFVAVYLATYFHLLREISYIKEKISEIQTQMRVVEVRLEIVIVLLILTIIETTSHSWNQSDENGTIGAEQWLKR